MGPQKPVRNPVKNIWDLLEQRVNNEISIAKLRVNLGESNRHQVRKLMLNLAQSCGLLS